MFETSALDMPTTALLVTASHHQRRWREQLAELLFSQCDVGALMICDPAPLELLAEGLTSG